VEQVLDGQFPKFAIGHEFSEDLLIALHAVDHETLEGFLEDVAEVVLGVCGGSFLQHLAFDGFFLNLVEEELVGLGKIRAEARPTLPSPLPPRDPVMTVFGVGPSSPTAKDDWRGEGEDPSMVLVPSAYPWDFATLRLRRSFVLRPSA
jgi:hypothetical protein